MNINEINNSDFKPCTKSVFEDVLFNPNLAVFEKTVIRPTYTKTVVCVNGDPVAIREVSRDGVKYLVKETYLS